MCGETALWFYYFSHTNMKHVTPVVACAHVILMCLCVYTVQKFEVSIFFLKELILLFSNDALNWSVKTITLFQKFYFK